MTNTKINSAGILIFDNETQESLVGDSDPMIAMLPDGDITIDSDLLPSINVEDDLSELAREQAQAKFVGVNELLAAEVPDNYIDVINQMSERARPGQWLRYDFKSEVYSYHDSINESEQALIYDCETFVKTGNYPIVAQAMSSKALWCWLHQSWDGTTPYTNTLVSIGSGQRTLVAHNSAFDFCRLLERFQFDTPIAVIDTMSIINCLHGMDSSSRWVLNTPPGKDARADRIRTLGCAKSLVASYNFCVAGPEGLPELKPADKKSRNIFVEADDFSEFIENRDELLSYSMLDIIYTFRLFKSIYRKFLAWSNGYEVLLGHSYTSEALLPVTEDREAWIAKCDDLSELAFAEINAAVFDAFTELHDQWLAGHPIALDKVDWKLHKPKGWRKRSLPDGWPRMAKWYVRFLSNDLGVTTLDFSRLLQLEYYGQDRWCPLEHHRSYGWHFKNKHGEATRVPHANGSDDNVGNIISSDSLRFFDDFDAPILRSKTLDYNSEALYYILRLCDSVTTWRGFRERIVSQITHNGI